jgi:hypothetical protein
MRQRKHVARATRFRRLPILLAFVAGFLLLLGGAAFAGYRYDQSTATRMLPGIRIQGVDVGGMTRSEALEALRTPVGALLDREITIHARDRDWKFTAERLGTRVDLEGAVDRGLSLSESLSWPARVYHYHRLLNKPLNQRITLAVTYQRAPVEGLVSKIAGEIGQAPRDAKLDVVDGQVVKTHSEDGRTLKKGRAADARV